MQKLLLSLLLLVFIHCSFAAEPTLSDFQKLESLWTETLGKLPAPGIAITVVKGDQVIYQKAFGSRDPINHHPFTTETVSYIASSTKSFVAMAVMILVNQGKIDLDQPVQKYLSYFRIKDPILSSKITVRDLLSHKYGLDHYAITFAESYTGEIHDEKFKRLLPETEDEGEFAYSNLHYTIAGRIIETVSGKTWKEFVKSEILNPAGMKNTYCNASEMYSRSDVAIPMKYEDGGWKQEMIRKTDRTMHSAGGMGATIGDLSRWLRLNINGEIDGVKILPRNLMTEMQTKQVDVNRTWYEFNREGYGLGWYIGSYREHTLIHHFGGYEGYRSHISFMPHEKIGVAVLVNQGGGNFADMIACQIYDRLLKLQSKDLFAELLNRKQQRENILAEFTKCINLKSEQNCVPPQEILGAYESDIWGVLKIASTESGTKATIGDLPFELQFTKRGRFITELPDGQTLGRFQRNDDGKITGVLLVNEEQQMEFTRK